MSLHVPHSLSGFSRCVWLFDVFYHVSPLQVSLRRLTLELASSWAARSLSPVGILESTALPFCRPAPQPVDTHHPLLLPGPAHACHAKRSNDTLETSKNDHLCRTSHRHGHTEFVRPAANGCGRLRTVATTNATSSEHTLNPQTPRVKREPLLRIREKTNLTWPMKQSDFPSRSQRIWSLKLKQSKKSNLQNAIHLIENVSTEQRSAFITIKWAARLLIPTDSYKAWNQNSVSQQNRLGTRTKIVKQQAFKTCHLLQRSVEQKKRRMKQSNDSTCKRAATIEKNVSCHACPSSCSMDHAWQPQNKTANGYICRISRI